MSNPDNPLWQVYNAMWTLLEADTDFTTAVPEDNRVKYTDTTDRAIELDGGLTSDFPRVRIRPLEGRPWAYRTSNSSMIVMRWSVEIESADRRLATEDVSKFFDVWFAIYRATTRWKDTIWDFTWDTDKPASVRRFRAMQTRDEVGENKYTNTPVGWVSVWHGETDVWFDTSDLTAT
jgi:hypothetical protein